MLEDDILNEIKKNEENKDKNEIVEVDENEEITNTQYDMPEVTDPDDGKKKKKKEKKAKGPSKWSKLSKKQKIIIIVSIVLVIIIIVVVLLWIFVFNKKDTETKRPEEPIVIIEKDNYRYEDGWLIFLDSEDNELGEYECANKDEELCYVAYYSNEDDFDVNKQVYENGVPIDFRSDILLDNYVFIYDNTTREDGNVKLYDIESKETMDEYGLVKEVNESSVIVKDDSDNYGVLTFSDSGVENLIDFDYDYLGYIIDTDAIVGANNNNYVLIGLDGEDVSKNIPGEIKNFDGTNISVDIDGEYFIYNYQGVRQSEESYDYIRFVDTYIIAADNKKLYVFDSEVDPMTLDGIRISSSDYNTKLIFNDDLVQTGKEVAFDAYVNGNTLRIDYGEEEYVNVNLNEGKFSKTQEYYSYMQGKLYFYSDAEKTELLGSYACNYANEVTDTTTELTNCFIAKESNTFKESDDVNLGYLPIYNERFVFITDTSRPNANDNIILYDLNLNKNLATYKEVDAKYYNGESESKVNFVETAGTIVLAKNTSDSYGLINIGNSSVTGLIAFKDSDSNATNTKAYGLNGNIVMQRSDGTYHLYDTKGNEITKNIETKNEIVDYKGDYILVKSGDNYLIYNLDGSIASDEYKYIIMEEAYYITVDGSNNVGVFTYDSDTNLAQNLGIVIDGKDYASEIKYGVNKNVLVLTYTHNGSNQVVEINLG